MTGANGGTPDRDPAEESAQAQFKLDEYIFGMRELMRAEAESRAEYERLVEASKTRERRIAKAIAALEGEPLSQGGRPKATKPKAQQSVDPKVADRVLATMKRMLEETGESAVTRPQLVKAMQEQMSGETVRRGLGLLREQERVRQAGRAGGGGRTSAILYALMPNGD